MNTDHPIWFIPVVGTDGQIGLTPCPGTQNTSLEHALKELKEAGVVAVLTLMTDEEMARNQVAELGQTTVKLGMRWFHLPILDDQAPEKPFLEGWKLCHKEVHTLLEEGKKIAIHCKGGSGRTGLVAIQILLELGASLEDATALVQSRRPLALTPEVHREYIKAVASSLS